MKKTLDIFWACCALFITNFAIAQNCVDGQPIRPTYTSGQTQRYWGEQGIALAGTDLFFASTPAVCVMKPVSPNGYGQTQLISTGQIDCIAAEADTMVVGYGSSGNGSVKIYRKQTNGTYALGATLSGPVSNELFGYRVALSEDATTLAIGAQYAGAAPLGDSGKVYVYTRSVTTGAWTLLTSLTPQAGSVAYAQFGSSVSVSGTKIAVADKDTYGYVFSRSGNTYTQQVRLTNSLASFDRPDIKLSGDWVWFKQYDHYDAFQQAVGATTWILKQTLILSSPNTVWNFRSGRLATSESVYDTLKIRVRAYTQASTGSAWMNSFTADAAFADEDEIQYSLNVAIQGDLIATDASRMDYGSVINFGGGFIFDTVFNDCNGNGVRDECDIAGQTSQDSNGNAIPDECESLCRADVNADGVINGVDLSFVLGGWGNCPP